MLKLQIKLKSIADTFSDIIVSLLLLTANCKTLNQEGKIGLKAHVNISACTIELTVANLLAHCRLSLWSVASLVNFPNANKLKWCTNKQFNQ